METYWYSLNTMTFASWTNDLESKHAGIQHTNTQSCPRKLQGRFNVNLNTHFSNWFSGIFMIKWHRFYKNLPTNQSDASSHLRMDANTKSAQPVTAPRIHHADNSIKTKTNSWWSDLGQHWILSLIRTSPEVSLPTVELLRAEFAWSWVTAQPLQDLTGRFLGGSAGSNRIVSLSSQRPHDRQGQKWHGTGRHRLCLFCDFWSWWWSVEPW